MEELFLDFLNAGDLELHPTNPDEAYLVTDHHGDKTLLPKIFLPESFNWPLDKILADPDPSEGRPFKSNDCVRLMTDKYIGHGLPKGIEGYVSGVVSNEFLGWEANRCHVMFIIACKDDTTVQDFLEVQEDQLQLCNKKHPPSQLFLYQVARNGQVIRDQQSGSFERHKESKPYTYEYLLDSLKEELREIPQQEGEKSSFPKILKKGQITLREIRQKLTKRLKRISKGK